MMGGKWMDEFVGEEDGGWVTDMKWRRVDGLKIFQNLELCFSHSKTDQSPHSINSLFAIPANQEFVYMQSNLDSLEDDPITYFSNVLNTMCDYTSPGVCVCARVCVCVCACVRAYAKFFNSLTT